MQAGMGGSAIPLSEFLNPTPPGQFRVGALGTQLGQLGPRALQILLPLAMQRFQQRQEDAAFQRSLAELPEDQREAAWKAHYHPKAFAADVQAESQNRAEQAAIDKERRAALLEAAKNERELGEKIDAEKRAQGRWKERRQISLDIDEAKRNRDLENLRSSLGEVGPQYAQMASEIGMALPEGKLRYMATPEQKKKWSEMTGDPGMDIVTDEDLAPIREAYSAYSQGSRLFGGQKEVPAPILEGPPDPSDPNSMSPTRIVESTPERRQKFQDLVRLNKGDTSKAYAQMISDEEKAQTHKKEEDRLAREEARTKLTEERKRNDDLRKLDIQIAEAQAKATAAWRSSSETSGDRDKEKHANHTAEARAADALADELRGIRARYFEDAPAGGATKAPQKAAPASQPTLGAPSAKSELPPLSAFGWRDDSNTETMRAALGDLMKRKGSLQPKESAEMLALAKARMDALVRKDDAGEATDADADEFNSLMGLFQ